MNWHIEDDVPGANIGFRAIVDADGTVACLPSPMGEANARLIHAAPDLLAALEGLLGLQDGRYVTEGMKREATEQARVAIAKAKTDTHPPHV
jgi:hypothetical protein